MKKVKIALVKGDGSGPEMMEQALKVSLVAAKKDGFELDFIETPMGWNAYDKYGDTLPAESFKLAKEIGIIFFGGVGDFTHDSTIGVTNPQMKPEVRALMAIRREMELLLNFRPIYYYKALSNLAKVRPEEIPEEGIKQIWIRFLLQDSYFGNDDLKSYLPENVRKAIGNKPKNEITGNEELITDFAYYRRATIIKYIRAAFTFARGQKLPLISIDKSNVMPRYDYWRKIVTEIGKNEFPDVILTHQLVDSAAALLFTPSKLNGVIACGNEHGDILSDGAASAMGSMGLMASSAINPDTGKAMFESGAGTAPTLAGQDKANPLGRILTGALMLRHIGAGNAAIAIEKAVNAALTEGYRTGDLFSAGDDPKKLLGTKAIGELVAEKVSH
ncbi:MAG: isocitrate/isopropylmalate family dehydrogenase [Candidatus Margulisiibacteriota bacterium]